jgi:ABC-2 type transport system ATP-binding protein
MHNVRIDNVFFAYAPEKPVLRGLTFEVAPREIVGLLGANGSGKTTTFKLLSGLLHPDEGHMTLAGISVTDQPREALKKCAYVPDESLLYPHFSALENMNLFAILWGVEGKVAKLRTEQLLRAVGLWEVRKQWVKSYSRGMKQKLSICVALLHEPKVLLMDEPFTGLDIDALLWARELLKAYASQEDRSIVFTSHTPEVVESLANRVVILKDGVNIHEQRIDHSLTLPDSLAELYQRVVGNKKLESPTV